MVQVSQPAPQTRTIAVMLKLLHQALDCLSSCDAQAIAAVDLVDETIHPTIAKERMRPNNVRDQVTAVCAALCAPLIIVRFGRRSAVERGRWTVARGVLPAYSRRKDELRLNRLPRGHRNNKASLKIPRCMDGQIAQKARTAAC